MDLKKFLKLFKSDGHRLVIFDVTDKDEPQILTTEPLSDFPGILGRSIACAVRAMYKSGNRKYSQEEILQSILAISLPIARQLLQQMEKDELSKNRRSAV